MLFCKNFIMIIYSIYQLPCFICINPRDTYQIFIFMHASPFSLPHAYSIHPPSSSPVALPYAYSIHSPSSSPTLAPVYSTPSPSSPPMCNYNLICFSLIIENIEHSSLITGNTQKTTHPPSLSPIAKIIESHINNELGNLKQEEYFLRETTHYDVGVLLNVLSPIFLQQSKVINQCKVNHNVYMFYFFIWFQIYAKKVALHTSS